MSGLLEKTALHKNIEGLKALEGAVEHDLELLAYPTKKWVLPHQTSSGANIFDVLIVGGGQSGLAIAFALQREKVENILVIDENSQGQEGPWLTFARMHTLRTPKHLTGLDLGIANLTVRAWFEAQFGANAWNALGLLPKEQWAEYLQWCRKLLNIPVKNQAKAGAIEWDKRENCFSVPLINTASNETETVYARIIVLATGIDGCGRWETPTLISKNLSQDYYAHTRDNIDFAGLKAKTIAVLGAGASAFDNASCALESGAKAVHLFHRRKNLPNVNPYRWAEFVGFLKHHADLPDKLKWRFILQILHMGQLPPADTFARAQQHPNFFLHNASPWKQVEQRGSFVHIVTPTETFDVDFVIIGTGCITDLSLRPELSKLRDQIALWQDRYIPEPDEMHEDLLRHPYLGKNFQFQEKQLGQAPYLNSIYNYTFGCLLSSGFGGASISGMKYSIPRLIYGITRQLYVDDAEHHYQTLVDFNTREF